MKRSVLIVAAALAAGPLPAAESNLKGDIIAAAAALAEQPNYSWSVTVDVPEGTRFRPGPTEGKIEKDGFTYVTIAYDDKTTCAVIKGDKRAITDRDGEWRSMADLDGDDGPGRWLGGMLRSIRTPAEQAGDLVAAASELTKEGDAYTGALTGDGAGSFLRLRGSRGGDPSVSEAQGTVTFWLEDGVMAKYTFNVSGTISFRGKDWETDRTTTVEIKDIGATAVEVPGEATEKLM